MRITLFILGFLISAQISLYGKGAKGDISPIFDISPDGKYMVIAIFDGKTSNLWQYSLIDKSLSKLTEIKGAYHSRPVYSPNGDKVMFLDKDLDKQKSDICIIDINSKKIVKLTNSESYITEAIFNHDGDKVLFCAAEYLGNYSPIARKAPHDLDLYSISISGNEKKKLTNLSAYGVESISLSKTGDSLICELTEKEFAGIYLISLVDTSVIQKIEAINNPRPQIGNSFYGNPVYSSDFKSISFMAPYQLYTLDLQSKECKLTWDNTKDKVMAMPIFSRFMDSDKKIVISALKIVNRQYTSNADIYIVDVETLEIETLTIK